MAFGVDGQHGENVVMMREALEIMLGIWAAEGEFKYSGKYWNVHIPPEMIEGNYRHHMHTFTKPHPPIGVTVLVPESEPIKLAGSRGYMPLSIYFNDAYTLVSGRAMRSLRKLRESSPIAASGASIPRSWLPTRMPRQSAWPLKGRSAELAASTFGSSARHSASSRI